MSIKERVGQLVKKYNTNDPFKLAERLGITIVFEPLGSILGYYSRSHRSKVIHINEASDEQQQLSTCAHELGHAVLHPNENTAFLKANTFYSTDRIETEANMFAVELLFKKGGDQPVTVNEAIEEYGIPKQFLYKNF